MSLHPSTRRAEPHAGGLASRLNWLRAGVLGANDGIVSTAGLVVGVAGATTARGTIVLLRAGQCPRLGGRSGSSGRWVSRPVRPVRRGIPHRFMTPATV
jgi:hypothetical protein